jgi:hypothetical protein
MHLDPHAPAAHTHPFALDLWLGHARAIRWDDENRVRRKGRPERSS